MNDNIEPEFDKYISFELSKKKTWKNVIDEIEERKALGNPKKGDKEALIAAKQHVKLAEDAIDELIRDRDAIAKLEVSELQASTIAEEKEMIKSLVDDFYIGYLLAEGKYMYCRDVAEANKDIVNPVFQIVEAHKFGRILNKMAKKRLKLGTRALADELADYFQDCRKDYTMTTCSFNTAKWSSQEVYNKASVIMNFWVMPEFSDSENYDKRFDFLINCIGGGKQENIDHLEKWVGYKRLYPERVANTPNLDIGGYPGGNGKGRFVELCKTIFTNPCVSAANLDELTKFNSAWEMAALLYYDEPEQNELPEGKLKNATGSEDIRIERKGIDATMADRTYSLVFLSNNPNGVVKLAGTGSSGEDRRYSVIVTNLVMVDEAMKLGMNLEEAKVFVNGINDLIKNRREVGKWLGHIIAKHNTADISVLQPLHGQDYKLRFNDQKTLLDVAFDLLLPVFVKNEIMPFELLKASIISITGWDKLKDKTIKQDWKRYLEKNKVAHNYMDGDSRAYIEYNWKGINAIKMQKSTYILQGSLKTEFDLSTLLKKQPVNIKMAKDSCEIREMLIFDEN